MLDNCAIVDLLEAIQAHGGMAHRALCAALLRLVSATTVAAEAEATDDAIAELIPFAYQRAWREFSALPTKEAS